MSLLAANTDFERAIKVPLAAVERVVREQLRSPVRMVSNASTHLLRAGGKRLRPSLVLLCAQACDPAVDRARMTDVAAAAELIHMATLMHDDVIDGAESRRGRSTANRTWGNQVSVLSGDYILARAFSLLSGNGDMRIMQRLSRATASMVEGELRQMEARGKTGALIEAYESIIRGKTAEFVAACCGIGAIVAGAGPSLEESVELFGLNYGLAFQITDDLLDLMGDPAETGKPLGGDIREGKITMPLILALRNSDQASGARLESLIHGGEVSEDDLAWVQSLVRETDAVEGTRRAASRYAERALESLARLPESESRVCLEEIARSVVDRRS